MSALIFDQTDQADLSKAADFIAEGHAVGVYFNATYAFLGDADQSAPADQIFRIKNRPRSKSLSLVCDPIYLPEFIDQLHPMNQRFPTEKIVALWERIHAVGLVFPASAITDNSSPCMVAVIPLAVAAAVCEWTQ